MAANAKPAAESGAQSAYNSIAGLVGDVIRQGTEGLVATQKILLDLAAQQNALVLTIVRERLGFATPQSRMMADFAKEGIKNLMEVQRQMLDIASRENSIVQEGLKPALGDSPIKSLTTVVHQGLENFIATHKEFLNIIQDQAVGVADDLGDGKRPEATRLLELARDGTKTFLESQKKFLNIVEDQIEQKEAAAPATNGSKSVDIFDMAKKSVDTLIEAQQRLLDLASAQVKANVKFVQNVFSVEVRPTTVSDVLKKSVDRFVAAQKALVDLASKPRKAEETAHECPSVAA